VAAAALVGLTLVAAGCSGSSGQRVAQVETTDTTTTHADSQSGSSEPSPTAYSACMRSHGVPNFPDPDSSGRIQIPEGAAINPRSQAVRAAQRACRDLEPRRGSPSPQEDAQLQERLLAFASCMRSHGVPGFPDPQAENGHIQIQVTAGQVDPNSPIVRAATAACQSELRGDADPRFAEKLVQGAAGPTRGKGN
jgi:hypothetical protein